MVNLTHQYQEILKKKFDTPTHVLYGILMSTTPDYSKKILKILADSKAVALPTLAEKIAPNGQNKAKYAVNRSLKNLFEGGFIEEYDSGQNTYARLSKTGRRRAMSQKLESVENLVPNWDGKWRIVLLDLPETRKNERESLRYLLKKAGFVCLKNSAWISPFPFEHLFMNIKKDLGLSTELMIMITENLDPETEAVLMETFGK